MNTSGKDQIFAAPAEAPRKFAFDERVVAVFPDMIKRSVPGYDSVIQLSGQLAARFARPNSNVYDLGCSLGATSIAMASSITSPGCTVVAVDNSQAMIAGLKTKLGQVNCTTPIRPVYGDVQGVSVDTASVAALNYTLQFIPPNDRAGVLDRIYRGMLPKGVLILSEKIAFQNPEINQHFIDLYHDFKRANGYSDLEISQKRDALEEVLIPETLETQQSRLRDVGFSRTEVWFQCFNFVSILAFK
ncbi:MAG: carboxy-S-adenosyl-L-methionine synthase CmoA [Pseudomonadota bacterium]